MTIRRRFVLVVCALTAAGSDARAIAPEAHSIAPQALSIAPQARTAAADARPTDPRATPAPLPSDAANATTRWSEQHRFRVHYDSTPAPVPLLTIHRWTVTIRDADDRPVSDAVVTVVGGMPAHGHGLPTVPRVRELGDGRYLVEGLKFHMPGAWVVAFRIKAGAVVDSVRFALELP